MSRAQKQNPKLFPTWLQLLHAKTNEEDRADLSMTGRVKTHVSDEARALSSQIAAVDKATNSKVRALETKLDTKLAELEAKLEAKLDVVINSLGVIINS